MSSDEQEHSIESQRMVAEGFVAANGHVIVDEYIDLGIAGDLTADNRPAFQRMLSDARGGWKLPAKNGRVQTVPFAPNSPDSTGIG